MSRHRHRFYVGHPIVTGDRFTLPEEHSRQIASVLRLRSGDRIELFNGDGLNYPSTIVESMRTRVVVDVDRSEPGTELPRPPLHLALAMIKADRFEWALQKVTELGVRRIIPMSTEYCVISLRVDREERRRQRWERIVIEASEQSGRCTVPEVMQVATLADVICDSSNDQRVLLWEDETTRPLAAMPFDAERPLVLMVGPEGGFSAAEIETVRDAGVNTATLGRLTLRSETAAVAGVAVMAGRELSRAT